MNDMTNFDEMPQWAKELINSVFRAGRFLA